MASSSSSPLQHQQHPNHPYPGIQINHQQQQQQQQYGQQQQQPPQSQPFQQYHQPQVYSQQQQPLGQIQPGQQQQGMPMQAGGGPVAGQGGPLQNGMPQMQQQGGAQPAAGQSAPPAPWNLIPGLDREKFIQMNQRQQLLRKQGETEQTSPELANIASIFGAVQQRMSQLAQMRMAQQQQQQQQQQQPQQNSPPQGMGQQGMQMGINQQPSVGMSASQGGQQPQMQGRPMQPSQPLPVNGFTVNGQTIQAQQLQLPNRMNGNGPMQQQGMPPTQNMQSQQGRPGSSHSAAGAAPNGVRPHPQAEQNRPSSSATNQSFNANSTASPQVNGAAGPPTSTLSAAPAATAPNEHVVLSPQQMQAFKAQIFALRYLQKGLAIPPGIAQMVFNMNIQPASAVAPISAVAPGSSPAGQSRSPSPFKQSTAEQAGQEKANSPHPLSQPQSDTAKPGQVQSPAPMPSAVPAPEPLPPVEPEIEIEEIESTLIAPYNAYRNPRAVLSALRQAQIQQQNIDISLKNPVVPSLLPSGLDPYTLQTERNKYIELRIAQRKKELENLPANIGGEVQGPDEVQDEVDSAALQKRASQKLRALIELKSLNLLQKQKQMREEVVRGLHQATSLSAITDRNAYRAMRKITLKDARAVDALERQQKIDRENRAKQKHVDQLAAIAKHGRDMMAAHEARKEREVRLGRHIMRWHIEAEKEEQKRIERVSKERLKALRNNDEEAYMKLIDTAKDTRITHLLRQTDSFLDTLAQSISAQQEDAADDPMGTVDGPDAKGEIDEAAFGAAPVFQDEEKDKSKVDYYNVAHKVKETVTQQASILSGGQLKEYQIKGLQWMVSLYNNRLNGILADEMGLGKTIQTISLITYLIEAKKQPGPFLVIVPLSTLPNWTLEFAKWAPSVSVIIYKGSPPVRKSVQNQMKFTKFQVLLTTYEYIIKDRPFLCRIKWIHMIIDEGHRMKNSQSKLSQTLTQHYYSKYRLILTGTPLQNNLPELWALLNFVLPKVFNSQKSFDEWFNTPFANTGGQDKIDINEEEALLIIRRLHKVLRPFLLRRLKKDVEKELPDKVERLIKCRMSALQMKLYKQMKENGMLVTMESGKAAGSKTIGMKGLQNTIMQLRKICNHPFVYQPVEDLINPAGTSNNLLYRVCGKFELLDRILPKLFRSGHRVLMFFQMTEIMNIMEDYLRYRDTKFLRLDGHTKPDERSEMLALFNQPNSDIPIFLLSTRAGGLGLNLQTADTVIIYDSDWNPHQDLQAQDRAHRIGQKKEVRIFRFVTEKSVEEHILARAKEKLEIDKKVIQGGRFDNKSSAAEREDFLRSILESNEDDDEDTANYTDEEINDILSRSEAESELFTQMDLERIRSEELAWIQAGNRGPVPDRLIMDSELPEVYHLEHTIAPVVDAIIDTKRQKGVVHYDDGLTEEQWTAAIDDDNLDLQDVIESNRRRGKGSVNYNYGTGLDDDQFSNSGSGTMKNEEDWESQAGSPEPSSMVGAKKRKRGPAANTSRGTSVDVSSVNGDSKPKRRKTGKQAAAEDPERIRMKEIMDACLDAVEDLDNEEYGHQCAGLFYKLPSKRDYANYYIMIPQPICLDQIKKRVNQPTYYKTLDDFTAEMRRMFANAKHFNDESSVVYADAVAMENIFDETLARMGALTAPPQQQYQQQPQQFQGQAWPGMQQASYSGYGNMQQGAAAMQGYAGFGQDPMNYPKVKRVVESDEE